MVLTNKNHNGLVPEASEYTKGDLLVLEEVAKAPDKIAEAFNNSSGKKIMLARKDLDVPVALTSWGYLLKLQTIDETKIKEFIETNNDRGPEQAPI